MTQKLNQKNMTGESRTNQLNDVLQNSEDIETRTEIGDGIQTMVEMDNMDREDNDDLLDYEDDLSIEDGYMDVTMSNNRPV